MAEACAPIYGLLGKAWRVAKSAPELAILIQLG